MMMWIDLKENGLSFYLIKFVIEAQLSNLRLEQENRYDLWSQSDA
jgi:hypothetical protein